MKQSVISNQTYNQQSSIGDQ